MNYNVKYLLSGIFIIVFIYFLVWMRYFNQRKEEEHSDVSFEARLDSEVKTLYKQLGLGEEPNYFLAYRYLHPWFNLAILPPTVEIFLTKIALVMVTPDELLIRNIGNGMTFTSEHHRDLRQGLIRIPKSEIKEFEIRNWKKFFVFGDFLTIKTSQHSYYLQVRDDGLQKGSLSTKHFSDLKRQDFLGLLTDKRTF